MRFLNRCSTVIAVGVVMLLGETAAQASFVTFSVSGSGTVSIQATVDAFRAALGNPNNGNASGPLAGGRREINWDGGGATTPTTDPTPLTTFQNIRGALFTTPGSGFTQSPVVFPGLDVVFGNPAYGGLFATFSPVRVFTPVGSNITDVTFFIPGTNGATPATVGAFGAVFSDVDLQGSTSIQFFDITGASMGTFGVASAAGVAQSLSFLGVLGNAGEQIAKVRITSGNTALSATAMDNPAQGVDLVVMDDFIYSEPQAVPESSTFVLLGTGLVAWGIGVARRWRK